MSEGRHGAPLDQLHPIRLSRPLGVAFEGKLRAPAQFARCRRKPPLQRTPQPRFGPDAADQDDLSARLQDAGEFVERGFGVRHRGDDVLRNDDVERRIGKIEVLRVHDCRAPRRS